MKARYKNALFSVEEFSGEEAIIIRYPPIWLKNELLPTCRKDGEFFKYMKELTGLEQISIKSQIKQQIFQDAEEHCRFTLNC